jgi:hypothetical protein
VVDDKCYTHNYFSLEGKLHVLRVKHTVGHLHDSLILPLNNAILLRSIWNNLLLRDAMRVKKLMEGITNVISSLIRVKTLDPLLTLSFNKVFELLEFGKHLILGFNGVDPIEIEKNHQ